MCGRASLVVSMDLLRSRFGADPTQVAEDYVPRYNIAPSEGLVVVTNDEPETMEIYEWGFVPEWADDPDEAPNSINARSETVNEKPMFRDAFEHRRCLVLADGFYEWQGSRGSKQPYRICRTDREPFAFAGLWSHWQPPEGVAGDDGQTALATDGGPGDGSEGGSAGGTRRDSEDATGNAVDATEDRWTTTILTTSANSAVDHVHDRMPVMLEPDEEDAWLTGTPEEAGGVLDPYPSDQLETYPVSRRVNDPSNDDEAILDEIDIGTQVGLDDFEA